MKADSIYFSGVTHDETYSLYRIGELASKNLKIFAETGKTDFPTNETNVESSIYEEFSSPPVKSGVGKTEVNFFVDGNHSMVNKKWKIMSEFSFEFILFFLKVSTIVKIVPSPDWFVGIDAFDLCNEGNWIDMVTVEVKPIGGVISIISQLRKFLTPSRTARSEN